jgi:pimeloyl-ACP methyl ester carboxylesterase
MGESYRVNGLHVERGLPAPAAQVAGQPPLLLVHGACHGAWCWELWLERLPALGWEAHALSLRNHPGSRAVEPRTYLERTRVEDYADDVAAVAEVIGRPCVVVGHSMGGIVAQRFAARAAAGGKGGDAGTAPAPAGLVLLASVGPGQLGPASGNPVPAGVPFLPPDPATRYFQTAAAEVRARAVARLVPESPAVVNEFGTAPGVSVAPGEIACPVLVVTAGHDRSMAPRDRRLADYYGADYLHDAENAHDLMLEGGWEPLLRRILDWTDARARAGGP